MFTMDNKYKISVARDFSQYPGGRYKSEGENSGEDFLLNHLLGKLFAAVLENSVLEIDLTGMNGYPSSFISGSFGKLAFEVGKVLGQNKASKLIKEHIILKCEDSSSRIKAVEDELANPVTKSEKKKK